MNPTSSELAIIARLLAPRLAGALVQKIHQPDESIFVFHLFSAEEGKTRLLVDLTPFDMTNHNEIFLPVAEPHGVIEATLER